MSSYNYIGATWAGACSELLNPVLREKWGFQGMVLTDYFGNYGYMDACHKPRGEVRTKFRRGCRRVEI